MMKRLNPLKVGMMGLALGLGSTQAVAQPGQSQSEEQRGPGNGRGGERADPRAFFQQPAFIFASLSVLIALAVYFAAEEDDEEPVSGE